MPPAASQLQRDNLLRQCGGTLARLRRAVLGAHVDGAEHAASEFCGTPQILSVQVLPDPAAGRWSKKVAGIRSRSAISFGRTSLATCSL